MPFKIKETILGFSIAIILVFFVVFGIRAFYKQPKYEDFCPREKFENPMQTEKECLEIGGRWSQNIPKPVSPDGNVPEGWCDAYYTCGKNFNEIREVYNRKVFIIAGIIGIIVIIIASILHLTSVSSGLLGGGVLTVIFGTITYWSDLADWGRFIILGIALAVLIWIGYTKINKKEK